MFDNPFIQSPPLSNGILNADRLALVHKSSSQRMSAGIDTLTQSQLCGCTSHRFPQASGQIPLRPPSQSPPRQSYAILSMPRDQSHSVRNSHGQGWRGGMVCRILRQSGSALGLGQLDVCRDLVGLVQWCNCIAASAWYLKSGDARMMSFLLASSLVIYRVFFLSPCWMPADGIDGPDILK